MNLSIIIVNWNSVEFLRDCLASVYGSVRNISLEIVVVDNASYDGSAEMVRKEYPYVKFIQSPDNLGFAGANNLAVQNAEGRMLLFLNPDTELVGNVVENMLLWIDSAPQAGAVGPKILNSDRSLQTSCVRAFPTILNEMFDADWLRVRYPKSQLWGTQAFQHDSEASVVEAISGACFMMRRSVFLSLGGFNDDYFMYAEDTDLCFRAKKNGFTNYYIPWVSVIHHGGKSSGVQTESQFSSVMMKESLFLFMKRNRGYWYAHAWQAAVALAAIGRLGLLGTASVLHRQQRQSLSVASAKWRKILRWAVGLESWTKEVGARRGRVAT